MLRYLVLKLLSKANTKEFRSLCKLTFADTNTEGVLNRSDLEKTPLPGAAKNTFNVSLDYETNKFNIRVSYNVTDSYIDEFGGEIMEDRYYDSQSFLDVNASYSFSDNLRFYLQAKNLTNQPLRYYQGTEEYLMQEEFYGARYTAGFNLIYLNNNTL